jgi:hypothetical protein
MERPDVIADAIAEGIIGRGDAAGSA